MIEPGHRMSNAMAEAGSLTNGRMGGSNGRKRDGSQGKQAALKY
jgi:hypothetical protein